MQVYEWRGGDDEDRGSLERVGGNGGGGGGREYTELTGDFG
jgi:hypothetical protein